MKALTLRLADDDLAATIDLVARVEAVPVNVLVQRALVAYLDILRADPDFRRRSDALVKADQLALQRLAGN